MVGVLPEDIENLEVDSCDNSADPCKKAFGSIVDDEADKKLYDQRLIHQVGMLPEEDKLIVRYTVNVHSELSQIELFNQLLLATVGSTFEDNLQIFAFENVAVDLYNVDVGMSAEYKASDIDAADGRQLLLEVDDTANTDVMHSLGGLLALPFSAFGAVGTFTAASPTVCIALAGFLFSVVLFLALWAGSTRKSKSDRCHDVRVHSFASIV